jgi:hypothetical protein
MEPQMRPHGWDKGGFKPGNRPFSIKIRDQVGETLQVGAENGEVFAFAGDAPVRPPLPVHRTARSGTAAPQQEQDRSPVFRIERQTWQVTQASSVRPITLAKDDGGTSG